MIDYLSASPDASLARQLPHLDPSSPLTSSSQLSSISTSSLPSSPPSNSQCASKSIDLQHTLQAFEHAFFDCPTPTHLLHPSLPSLVEELDQFQQQASSPFSLPLPDDSREEAVDLTPLLKIHIISSCLTTLSTRLEALEPLNVPKRVQSPEDAPSSLLKSIRDFVKHILFSYT